MRVTLVLLAVLGLAAEAQADFPARKIPRSGRGFFTPDTWSTRGLRWGRPELVSLIQRAAERVANRFSGSRLYVADLSLKSGAGTPWHRTHREGVDVDLIFYALDEEGNPAPPPKTMVVFDRHGRGVGPDGTKLRFDTRRNWALVKALIMDPEVKVTRIYVSNPLRQRLLAHGVKVGDEPELLGLAGAIMAEPTFTLPHDDHFHVRIVPGVATAAARRGNTPTRERNAPPPATGSSRRRR